MTDEIQRMAVAARRAAWLRAGLCVASIVLVSVGAALIYRPAGLIAAGLLLYVDSQRAQR